MSRMPSRSKSSIDLEQPDIRKGVDRTSSDTSFSLIWSQQTTEEINLIHPAKESLRPHKSKLLVVALGCFGLALLAGGAAAASLLWTRTTTRYITMFELVEHNLPGSDCWVAIDGHVYDVLHLKHPGGSERVWQFCGADASDKFAQYHAPKSRRKLASLKIGTLVPTVETDVEMEDGKPVVIEGHVVVQGDKIAEVQDEENGGHMMIEGEAIDVAAELPTAAPTASKPKTLSDYIQLLSEQGDDKPHN